MLALMRCRQAVGDSGRLLGTRAYGVADFCGRGKKDEGEPDCEKKKEKKEEKKVEKKVEKKSEPCTENKGKESKKKEEKPKPKKLKKQMDICGKVAMVTGGASGIGKAVCKDLVCKGVRVAIVDSDSKKGKAFSDCINENMGCQAAMFIKTDVSNLKKYKEAFETTEKKLGCVDILFNNAGIFDDSPKGWSKEVDVNLKGVINGSLLAIERMGAMNGGPGGVVINSASARAFSKTSLFPVYRCTKAGVLSFTRSMGSEFHYKLNCIRFMALCPTFTETCLFENHGKKLLIPGKDMEKLFETRSKEFHFQQPESVSHCVMTMIEYGENGTTWLSDTDKPGQLVSIKDVKFAGVPVTTE